MAENGNLFDPPAHTTDSAPAEPVVGYTARDLWRFVNYYCKNIRNFPQNETVGVIRNIQRMLQKGVTVEEIAVALRNYEEDEWRKQNDPRYSMHVRSFFKKETIEQWQTPRPKVLNRNKAKLPFITIQPTVRPKPAEVQPVEDVDDL